MKKDTNKYVAPQIKMSEMDLRGLLCSSQYLDMYLEVDEYTTFDEEDIYF